MEPKNIAEVYETVEDSWLVSIFDEAEPDFNGGVMVVYDAPTLGLAWQFLTEKYPGYEIVSVEEFHRRFWASDERRNGKDKGSIAKKILAQQATKHDAKWVGWKPKPYVPTPSQVQRAVKKTGVAPPQEIGPDELIAPVQFAKWRGIPPQYVYNAIYHGKLQTVGERPKRAKYGDLCRYFGSPPSREEVTNGTTP